MARPDGERSNANLSVRLFSVLLILIEQHKGDAEEQQRQTSSPCRIAFEQTQNR